MNLGNRVFGAMAWSGIERILLQGIQFVLGIILARILSPDEYGTMAILLVFIVLSRVFINSGFSKALIQKIDRDENDKSTVFLFNIAISLVCYFILWVTSNAISEFYEIPELVPLFKVLGISLIINALYAVPRTLFTIDLNFKLITKINLTAVILAGILAIYLAKTGFGVWALVYQVIARSTITCLITWAIVKWKPNWRFSKSSFKQLFDYGSKLLVSSLLATLFTRLNALLIGKFMGASDLGYYSRGSQFSDVLYNTFSPAINGVLLPGLAPLQDQPEVLTKHASTIIKTTTLITLPFFMIITVLAEPIILVLLTDKWAPAIPIMQLFGMARLVTVIGGINMNLLYIVGRTDLVLRQQYVCIAIRVALVVAALPFGVIYVALAELLSSTIHYFINAYFPGKLLGYGGLKQLRDVMRILLCGLIMAVFLGLFLYFFESKLLQIIAGPIVCLGIYILMAYLFKIKELKLLLDKAKQFVKRG